MTEPFTLFVGTYSTPHNYPPSSHSNEFSEGSSLTTGIHTLQMDPNSGDLHLTSIMQDIDEGSYLTLDPDGRHLYAISESSDTNGEGRVYAYQIHSDGKLGLLNSQSTGGENPCHLAVDSTDSCVIVANYMGGSVCMLPLDDSGRLKEKSDFIQHKGSSINPHRQDKAHAHSINIDPSNSRAYVCDLGMDQVLTYKIDLIKNRLLLDTNSTVDVEPGQGPRHFAFHPSLNFCYIINELGSTVTMFEHDPSSGQIVHKQQLPTLPKAWKGVNGSADIHVSPNGKHLYASNRGHDSIAIFAIDGNDGKLTAIGHADTHGKTPRNFTLTPDNKFLIVANQNSDNLVVFSVDDESGLLTFTGRDISVPKPVCIQIQS